MLHPGRRCPLFVLFLIGVAVAGGTALAQDSTLSPYFVVTGEDPETDRLAGVCYRTNRNYTLCLHPGFASL